MMQLFFVRADKFRITQGEVRTFESSETGRRDFCPSCGTPIAFRRSTRPEIVTVMGGSLDDPALFRPLHHIWSSDDQAWFHQEGVPAHDGRIPEVALKELFSFEE